MKSLSLPDLLRTFWTTTLALLCGAMSANAQAQTRVTTLTTEVQGLNRVYHLTAEGAVGSQSLEASSTLLPNSWVNIGNAAASGGTLRIDFTNPIALEPRYRFFRLVAGPAVAPQDVSINSSTSLAVDELHAKKLTIATGATVTAPGDLIIKASEKITLNGQIKAGGRLILVAPAGLEAGPNALIDAGEGDVLIVSAPELVPSEEKMGTEFSAGFGVGVSGVAGRVLASSVHKTDAFGNHTVLPRIRWAPGARKKNLWVHLLGTLDVGAGGTPAAPITLYPSRGCQRSE